MTKTKNYQLPQWGADDPVRRKDFNEAMANIDLGMADNYAEQKQDHTEQKRDLAALAQAALQRMELINYNLYLSLLEGHYRGNFTGPMQAMCCNALTTDAELTAVPEDSRFVSGGGIIVGSGSELTFDLLNETVTEWTDGELPAKTSTATASITFRCVRPGTLTGVKLCFSYAGSYSSESMILTVRLFDLESQSYVYTSGELSSGALYGENFTKTLKVAAPLERGHAYRLEAEKTGTLNWTGSFGFGSPEQRAVLGTLSAEPLLTNTAAMTMTAPTGSSRAVAVVRYSGDADIPVVTLDGQAMTPGDPRQVTSVSGKPCTERLYSLTGEFSGTAALAVQLTATADTQMILHDFGGMLL